MLYEGIRGELVALCLAQKLPSLVKAFFHGNHTTSLSHPDFAFVSSALKDRRITFALRFSPQ